MVCFFDFLAVKKLKTNQDKCALHQPATDIESPSSSDWESGQGKQCLPGWKPWKAWVT